MHWCGLLIIAVAACSTADSVAIEIETHDPAIVRVELFVAGAPCANCDGIAPPGTDPMTANSKPLGDVSFVVGKDRFDVAVGGDGIAGFLLVPDGQHTMVPRLAAIGFDANGTPRGFVVDDTSFDLVALLNTKRRYQLESRTVEQALQAGDDQIVTWRTEGTDPAHPPPSCLAIVRHGGETEFFSPEADPDCDGFLANDECDPTWYKYKQPTGSGPQECVAADDLGKCQIGRSGTCVDGDTAPTCMSINKFCVPQAACTRCMPPYSEACLTGLANDPTVTHLHCQIPIFTDATNLTTCLNASDSIDLDQFYGTPCTVGFVQDDNSGNITTSIDITTTNGDIVGTLDRSGFSPDCSFGFSTTITVTNIPTTTSATIAKGALAITQGGAETLLMPIVVTYVNGGPITDCTEAAMTKPICEIVPMPDLAGDTMWQCAAHQ
jgi:hypothetical protein